MLQSIGPHEALKLSSHEHIEVIDVRELFEWDTGHIQEARHVPLAVFRNNPAAALRKKAVIFVCAAGVRSDTAARLALGAGLPEAYNLTGGMKAWIAAGLPIAREASVPAAV